MTTLEPRGADKLSAGQMQSPEVIEALVEMYNRKAMALPCDPWRTRQESVQRETEALDELYND